MLTLLLWQQPTRFWLDSFSLPEVFETPDLIQALASYSENRQDQACRYRAPRVPGDKSNKESLLLLRIHAAADFYSTEKALMLSPPPVGVDIILDPYIFNVFPQSLLPTGILVVVIAIGAWTLSGVVWRSLRYLNTPGESKPHKE